MKPEDRAELVRLKELKKAVQKAWDDSSVEFPVSTKSVVGTFTTNVIHGELSGAVDVYSDELLPEEPAIKRRKRGSHK